MHHLPKQVLGKVNWANKNVFEKVLDRADISLIMLETLITEIEALLNDRPLTYVSTDVQDTEPLTPAHLLYGKKIITLPYERKRMMSWKT